MLKKVFSRKGNKQKKTIKMPKLINANNLVPPKTTEFEEFCLWYAMPYAQKKTLGLLTQKDFSENYDVAPQTLSRWKDRPEFMARVTKLRNQWAFEKTQDVIQGIYSAAVGGNALSQKLWLQFFLGFSEKSEVTTVTKVEITTNDIRHLINQLPENLKNKHNANLRELLDDAISVANARDVEDSRWTTGLADPIPVETYHDAQDVSGSGSDEVATSHKVGLRANMVWEPFANHNKSPSRRWKE